MSRPCIPRLGLALCAALSLFPSTLVSATLTPRDGHGHGHGGPLMELNETEVTMWHSPTPPSYYTIDWEDPDQSARRYPGLMITHAILMSLAFFLALPISIALRSVKHPWRSAAVVAFYAFSILGCASSALYTKLTPNMYDGSVHGRQGYYILAAAIILTTVDIFHVIARSIAFFRNGSKFTFKRFWSTAILGRDAGSSVIDSEYIGLVSEEPEELELEEAKLESPQSPSNTTKRVHYSLGLQEIDSTPVNPHSNTAQWANNVHRHRREDSQSGISDITIFGAKSSHSDETLHDLDHSRKHSSHLSPLRHRIGRAALAVSERALVFAGFHQLITGIVIYTGGCRENYENGCLAHLIKGGIFWCYGLVTFARFLGSFSELGWSWNRAPLGGYPSAEFVESFVIFLYGITNTWMERFGANPGDPFTTKQIQHISIAVMFWFAGLVGMAIESKRVRNWLASSTIAALHSDKLSQETVAEPPSYITSFNPFPALVIGVTGAAMAAHHQTYLFQVQIHELWGNLLVGFSVIRCLTYFFLWLGPPRSILPSRPPTEALGSFFLACGGLVFMFSTEEVTIAAMRRGRDDVMMFLNVAVALTCLGFCWTICIVAFKGWLKSHTHPRVSYHSSA